MKGIVVNNLDDTNRILLLKRAKICYWMPGKWGLPGGKVEKGETATEAAIRETREETQLRVDDLTPIEEHSNSQVDIFYARRYTGTVEIDFEHDDFAWVSRDDVKNYDTIPYLEENFDWVLQNER